MGVFWRAPDRDLQIQRQILAANHWADYVVHSGGVGGQTGRAVVAGVPPTCEKQ